MADEVDGSASPPAAARPGAGWWMKEVSASDLVAGVFEGGGAKGILYEGALRAMLERQRPRWFSAVAGSSAGGITAALIAAGLRPEEIARETDAALATLQVDSRWAGLARLRRGRGYIPTTSLETWLRRVLREHLGARLGRDDADLVTFIELFDATGIELDVVAVDIDARQPFVFNHRQTPDASVVLAVLASAAIPFAFSPLGRGGESMIVDGGVSSNFPRFVFDDRSFRSAAGLDELPVPTIAFILDEPVDSTRRPQRPQRPQRRPALIRALLWVLLLPVRIVIGWLPRLLGKNTSAAPARYPKPRGRAARSVLELVDGVLMFAVPPGIFLASTVAVTGVVGIGGWYVGWRPLFRTLSDLPGSVGESLDWILSVIILVLVSLIPIYVWVIVMAPFLAGIHVWPTARQVGYGLARTFVANPGAPAWAGRDPTDLVVRLRVPAGLTTLTSELDPSERATAIVEATEATDAVLDRLDTGCLPNP